MRTIDTIIVYKGHDIIYIQVDYNYYISLTYHAPSTSALNTTLRDPRHNATLFTSQQAVKLAYTNYFTSCLETCLDHHEILHVWYFVPCFTQLLGQQFCKKKLKYQPRNGMLAANKCATIVTS